MTTPGRAFAARRPTSVSRRAQTAQPVTAAAAPGAPCRARLRGWVPRPVRAGFPWGWGTSTRNAEAEPRDPGAAELGKLELHFKSRSPATRGDRPPPTRGSAPGSAGSGGTTCSSIVRQRARSTCRTRQCADCGIPAVVLWEGREFKSLHPLQYLLSRSPRPSRELRANLMTGANGAKLAATSSTSRGSRLPDSKVWRLDHVTVDAAGVGAVFLRRNSPKPITRALGRLVVFPIAPSTLRVHPRRLTLRPCHQ